MSEVGLPSRAQDAGAAGGAGSQRRRARAGHLADAAASIGERATRGGVVPFVALDRSTRRSPTSCVPRSTAWRSSSAFILGEEVERFEREFAEYCGVRHCVGVGLGHRGADDRAARGRHRPGRRGDRPGAHVHRLRAGRRCTPARRPCSATSSEGTGLIDLGAAAAAVVPPTRRRSCPCTSTARPATWTPIRALAAAPRPARRRGRGAGPRRDLPRSGRRAGSWARRRRSASIRARTSARSATAARSAPTTRRSPSRRGGCATSASGARASTSRSGFNERLRRAPGGDAARQAAPPRRPATPPGASTRRCTASASRTSCCSSSARGAPCVYHLFPILVERPRRAPPPRLAQAGSRPACTTDRAASDHPAVGGRARAHVGDLDAAAQLGRAGAVAADVRRARGARGDCA